MSTWRLHPYVEKLQEAENEFEKTREKYSEICDNIETDIQIVCPGIICQATNMC